MINYPKGNVTALAYVSAEAAASVATSASSKDCLEDIGIVAIVVAELKLREIEREIFFAYVVERADDSALQQRPERFKIVGMHFAAHVLARFVIHVLVRECLIQLLIASSFIRGDQTYLVRDRIADETAHGLSRSIFDDLTDDIALARNRADNGNLARWPTARLFLVPMPVAIQAADVGFIDFDFAHQLWEVFILHRGADAMAHKPGGAVVATSDLAMNLKRADALLRLAHQIDDFKPRSERVVRVLKDRLCDDREPIAVAPAAILVLADPVERTRLKRVDLVAITARTLHAVRPAHIAEKRLAGIVRRVVALQLGKGDVRLSGQRLASYDSFIHEKEYSA
jgi:hypothetical protein